MPEKLSATNLLDPAVVARLMAQPLMSRFPMEGTISGHHRSPHRGSSVEFAEYRQYLPGDDLSTIDWKVYARSDRYYVKKYEEETNLQATPLVVGGVLYSVAGSRRSVVALDAATGELLWVHREDEGARARASGGSGPRGSAAELLGPSGGGGDLGHGPVAGLGRPVGSAPPGAGRDGEDSRQQHREQGAGRIPGRFEAHFGASSVTGGKGPRVDRDKAGA